MSNVIEFPTRKWADLEQSLKQTMNDRGYSQAAQQRIILGMRQFFDKIKFEWNSNIVFTYPLHRMTEDEIEAMRSDIAAKINIAGHENLERLAIAVICERFEREEAFCRTLGLIQ